MRSPLVLCLSAALASVRSDASRASTVVVQAGGSVAGVAAVSVQPGMRAILVNSRPGHRRDVFLGAEVVVAGPASPPVQHGKRRWMVTLPKRFDARSRHSHTGRYELAVDESMLAVYPPLRAGAKVRLAASVAAKVAEQSGETPNRKAQVVAQAGDGWLVQITMADGATYQSELPADTLRALAVHPDLANTELGMVMEVGKVQRKQERARLARSEERQQMRQKDQASDWYKSSQRLIDEHMKMAEVHMRLHGESIDSLDDWGDDLWSSDMWVDLHQLHRKMAD